MDSQNSNEKITHHPEDFLRRTNLLEALLKECNEERKFEWILHLGVNTKSVDKKEIPILHLAVESELFDVVKFLKTIGASVSETDNEGNTVLHALSKCQDKRIMNMVKSLWIKSGQGWMPVNKKNHSSLGNSLYNKNEFLTELLLSKLELEDFRGQRLLHIPIQKHFDKGLQMLINWQRQKLASPSILVCDSHRSPYQEAVRAKNVPALKLLFEVQDNLFEKNVISESWITDLVKSGKLQVIAVAWEHLKEAHKKMYLQKVCEEKEKDETEAQNNENTTVETNERKVKKRKNYGVKTNLDYVLKYRDDLSRRAQYLREHLLLTIDHGMIEQAEYFLEVSLNQFRESEEKKRHLRKIIYALYEDGETRLNQSEMTPLVLSITKKLEKVSVKLIDIERQHFMPTSTSNENLTIDDTEVRAHHASEISDPQHLIICFGSSNPSDQVLNHYFKYLLKGLPLNKRMEKLSQEGQFSHIKYHRQWAVQVFNHAVLHQVTNALATLVGETRKNVICHSPTKLGLLQCAVSSGKRLIIGELVHQEYLCHEENELEGTVCIKKQLAHDNDVNYTIDTFDSFYPESSSKKWITFVRLNLIPCFLGVVLICLDIWKDMEMTNDLDQLRRTSSDSENEAKYVIAFHISLVSQVLPLITTIPIWISKVREFWNHRSRRNQSPESQIEEPLLKRRESSALGNTHENRSQKRTIVLVVVPPVVALLAFTCFYFIGLSCGLMFVGMSNVFTGTMIGGLAVMVLIDVKNYIFGEDHSKLDLGKALHFSEREYALATIGESCLEANLQLGLQIWLLSNEQFSNDFEYGLIWGSIQILYSLFVAKDGSNKFASQVVFKLLLSCSSLIISVCGSYRHLKKRSMQIYHLIFIFISLNFQLWARMCVIFALSLYVKCSSELKIGGVLLFFGLNILIVFFLKQIVQNEDTKSWKNNLIYFLEGIASSTLLVRIPKMNDDDEIAPEESFKLQFWYFITTGISNCIWTGLTVALSNMGLVATFVEINVLLVVAGIFHTLYYTVFGHPWRIISRNRMLTTMKQKNH